MTITATTTPGKSLLSPSDHTLILIDFQSQMAFATKSISAELLRNNAALVANAAAGFGVSTILTTVAEKSFSGPMFDEIKDAFPGQAMLAAGRAGGGRGDGPASFELERACRELAGGCSRAAGDPL